MGSCPRVGCTAKLTTLWRGFQGRRTVHPAQPAAPDCSEFVQVGTGIRIRVIHIAPAAAPPPAAAAADSQRSSLSEEYWFTRGHRPPKAGRCSCSFRRSIRCSLLVPDDGQNNNNSTSPSTSLDAPPKRIVDVDTFVERVVQETLVEAFQEYCVLRTQHRAGEAVVRPRAPPPRRSSRCLQHGPGAARPLLLLLHGIGASADVWAAVVGAFAGRGYEVVAPDLLGHGYSSAPARAASYRFRSLVAHAAAVLDHYAPDGRRRCVLVGHSYGCSVAAALYRQRATQVAQLVLVSGGGPTPLAAPARAAEVPPFGCIHTLFKPLIYCGLKRSFLFASRGKHFGVCEAAAAAVPPRVLRHVEDGQAWPEGDAAFHRRILVPTLLVHGLQDTMVTLVQQCEMERTIPRAFLELIPNAGHMSMLETPEHLSHMIMCFIETWG